MQNTKRQDPSIVMLKKTVWAMPLVQFLFAAVAYFQFATVGNPEHLFATEIAGLSSDTCLIIGYTVGVLVFIGGKSLFSRRLNGTSEDFPVIVILHSLADVIGIIGLLMSLLFGFDFIHIAFWGTALFFHLWLLSRIRLDQYITSTK